MTPSTIILKAKLDGVGLALTDAGTIKAIGASAAVNRWLAVIREHKAGIIEALKFPDPASAMTGGTPPPPKPPPKPPPPPAPTMPTCAQCRHRSTLGGTIQPGHCGGRSDLEPAYGPGHPLRLLPDDGGRDCTAFSPRT